MSFTEFRYPITNAKLYFLQGVKIAKDRILEKDKGKNSNFAMILLSCAKSYFWYLYSTRNIRSLQDFFFSLKKYGAFTQTHFMTTKKPPCPNSQYIEKRKILISCKGRVIIQSIRDAIPMGHHPCLAYIITLTAFLPQSQLVVQWAY